MEPTSKKLSKRRFTRRIWTHCSRLRTCASSTTTRSACRPHPGCRCSVWWTPGFSYKLKSWPSCRKESTGYDVAQRGRQKLREASRGTHQFGRTGDLARRPQGRREGVVARVARRRHRPDPPSGSIGSAAHQRTYHDGFLRVADRIGDAAIRRDVGTPAIPLRYPSVRVPPSARRIVVGDEHALRDRGRRQHSAGAVRQFQYRAPEDGLSPRIGRALRAHHAGHFRRAFQLLVQPKIVGRARGGQSIPPAIAGFYFRTILRRAAQLPPLRLAGALLVRHIAGRIEQLFRPTPGYTAGRRWRH